MLGSLKTKVKEMLLAIDVHLPFFRPMLVLIYKFFQIIRRKYSAQKSEILHLIEENISPDRTSDRQYVRRILSDVLYCRLRYGTSESEYFVFRFDMLSPAGRSTFATLKNKFPYYLRLNNQNYTDFFNHKTETYRKFGQYYHRDVVCLYDETDYDPFLSFIRKHDRFIYKPSDDHGGHGIEILTASMFKSPRELFDLILSQGYCVLEELLVQGEELAQFHPQSINTVRLVTYRTDSGKLDFQWCFLRMGMGDSHTDNTSSGGLAAMIDPETGIVYTTGRDYLGRTYLCHPDTGVQLVGFKLPEWDKLLRLTHEVAGVLPEVRFVGWDFAWTVNGWTFVEGNSRPQCGSAQITEFNGKLHLYERASALYDAERKAERTCA